MQYLLDIGSEFINLFLSKLSAVLKMAADKILVASVSTGFLHLTSSRCWLQAHKLIFSKWPLTWLLYPKWLLKKMWFSVFWQGFFFHTAQHLLDIGSNLGKFFPQNGHQHGHHFKMATDQSMDSCIFIGFLAFRRPNSVSSPGVSHPIN